MTPLPPPLNRELTDVEIDAIVADAIAIEAASARREAQPPSSAIVWWRAQLRARQEAAHAADRPVTIVHTLAIACGIGLLLSVAGLVFGMVKGSLVSLASIDLTSRWIMLPMTAMLLSAVIASIAALVIFADE